MSSNKDYVCLGHCRAQERALYGLDNLPVNVNKESKDQIGIDHCWVEEGALRCHPETAWNIQKGSNGPCETEDEKEISKGYCRAQEAALRSNCKAAYEEEKASIKAYEDGWDDWDGPIWPWRQTDLSAAAEEHYDNGYTPPEIEEHRLAAEAGLSNEKK